MKPCSRQMVTIRFLLLEILVYGFLACFGPYIFALGLSRGYNNAVVSMAAALEMMGIMIGNLLWGRAADRFRTNRKTLIAALVISVLMQMAVFASRSFAAYAAAFIAMGTSFGVLGILVDSWMLREIGFDMARYRRIRSGGAIGYGVFMLTAGFVIERYGFGAGLLLGLAVCLAGVLAAVLTRETASVIFNKETEQPRRQKTGDSRHDVGLENLACSRDGSCRREGFAMPKQYLVWLLLLVLIGLALAPGYNMKIVILGRVGAGERAQGIDGFLGCMVQALMFFISGAMENYSAYRRMMLTSLLVSLGLVLYITAGAVPFIYIGSMLMYGSFSIVNPASREIVRRYIDDRYQTVANSICDTCYSHVAGMAAMLLSGLLVDRAGITALLGVCTGASLFVFAISLCAMAGGTVLVRRKAAR